MPLTKQHLRVLKPYLVGSGPNENGEWDMHCPLHKDGKRSAQMNVDTGKWFCHACDVGGGVPKLVRDIENGDIGNRNRPEEELDDDEDPEDDRPEIDPGEIAEYHQELLDNKAAIRALRKRRGISLETVRLYEIGWDQSSNAYTIPIVAADGSYVNIRRYQLDPPEGRRKIWSVKGHGSPDLYPIEQTQEDPIIICEGEWDALLTIQNGFPAITRTGAAKVWNKRWNSLFADRVVYLCHDMDTAGEAGNAKVLNYLRGVAAEIYVVELPYPHTANHGKDLTDYWLDGHTADDFKMLLDDSRAKAFMADAGPVEQVDVNVLDSFSAESYGKPLSMRVTITGKRNEGWMVPDEVEYTCTMDAGQKCQVCPMLTWNGLHTENIARDDPLVLKIINATEAQTDDALREHAGIEKCNKLDINQLSVHSVEQLYVRPSVERAHDHDEGGYYLNRRIISVGRHDTLPNTTVDMYGYVHPNPRDRSNEFLAHEVIKTETSIDQFHISESMAQRLAAFRPARGERPIAKAAEIADHMADEVTLIYGRRELHILMDLVYHSVVAWNFGGRLESRGWIDALILGDTRTGKSEAATKLRRHYNLGEMVSCETASFAGVVGGLQQLGNKEWEITWGVVPINDRRLVILDEFSGLEPEQIAQMSSIRSSGIAELTKIRSERTWARTRLLSLGNPRKRRMRDFTYGVDALRPLVGNAEDIARFDLVMAVSSGEVVSEEMNRYSVATEPTYSSEDCHNLLLWAWSRKPGQVVWASGAEQAVLDAAIDMGGRYIEDPPLIQAANVRYKIARVAVALAARTFSHQPGSNYENILVTKRHVRDAVWFIDRLYHTGNIGYAEQSEEAIAADIKSRQMMEQCKSLLNQHEGMGRFMRGMHGTFRVNDLCEMFGFDKDIAQRLVADLYRMEMVDRQGAHIKMKPALQELLRDKGIK